MKTPSEGQGEFIVAKHRNGALDSIKLKFIASSDSEDMILNFIPSLDFTSLRVIG